MRVLVVDDEVSQLQTLAALLNAEGFDVETCSTGREALERLGSGTFGVAVVDLLLPDLSGAELLGELSHCENSPHVILYTAFASYESARDAVNLGAFAYVEKASDPGELVSQVHRAFRARLQQRARQLEDAVAERTAELVRANRDLRREIAERQKVEAALRESEAQWRSLTEHSPDHVALLDRDGVILFVNRSLPALTREDLIGTEFCRHVLPEYRRAARACLEDVLRTGRASSFEIAYLGRDGTLLPFESYVGPVRRDGQIVGLIVSSRDIAERKEAEKALLESEERFRTSVENLLDCFGIYSAVRDGSGRIVDFRIEYVNEAACRCSGLSKGRQVGKCLCELFPAHRRTGLFREYCRVVRTGRPLVKESLWLEEVREGQPVRRAFDIRATRLEDGIAVSWRDVTERREMEEHLRQSQKMEAMGRLAGNVAHDFRNQLAVIRGYAEMILRQSLVSEEGREKVEEILKAAKRSARFTGELLAFSRKEILKPQVVDVCEVVAEASGALARMIGEDVQLCVLPCAGRCLARVDPDMFHQALVNLAVNAREAMPAGGTLTVQAGSVSVSRVEAGRRPGARPGRYVMVAVSDTGVGMDEQTRRRIFEPFFTTKQDREGTGLGLSMVYGFVTQSGGFLEVDSEPGKGSTFRLYFPAERDAPGAERAEGPAEVPARGTETILLVEDEYALRRMLAACLRESGYTVVEAATPTEALHLAEIHEGSIDLLVTDVVMPGMSGAELAGRFERMRPAARVLYVSGYAGEELTRRGVERGAVLSKPFSHEELLAAVRAALDAGREISADV